MSEPQDTHIDRDRSQRPSSSPTGGPWAIRSVAQVLGFAAGIALLWWCVQSALGPEKREELARLGQASAGQIAAVVVLSAVSLALNGAIFHTTLRPVRRLRMLDVQSTNAIATLLALLPFKLSLLFRVAVHRLRDGLPILTIGAWLAAMGVLILTAVVPIAGACLLEPTASTSGSLTSRWWLAAGAGTLTLGGVVIGVAGLVVSPRGWAVVEQLAGRVPSEGGRRLAAGLLPRIHEGVRMLADWRTVGLSLALRLTDIGVQTARLLVVAHIVGRDLPMSQAVLGASAYFLIGVLAPTGSLGVREAGTAGLFSAMRSPDFQVVVLAVTAVDTLVVLAAAMAGAAWLRPDRLLLRARRRAGPATPHNSPPSKP